MSIMKFRSAVAQQLEIGQTANANITLPNIGIADVLENFKF